MLSFSAQQIALMIQGKIEGDAAVTVNQFGKIESALVGEISFLANPKYEDFLYQSKASIIIVNESLELKKPVSATLIRVPDAYAAFATLLTKYQELKTQNLTGIQTPSFVAPSAKLGKDHFVAAFAYLGEGVKIGDQVKIFPNVMIGDNVLIGNNGSDGFGFAPTAEGSYQKVPQLGNVLIEDDVEIGANTTIDRATIGSTIIKKGVKLDNLVQIAHNVEVGQHTVIAAQVGLSGSTKVGKGVMMGGQSGAAGHLTIADGVKVAARSGITKTIDKANATITGFPAAEHSTALRAQIHLKNLPNLEKRVKELEILVKQLSQKGNSA